jgi:hypothetical protein
MSWASSRRTLILVIVFSVIAAIAAVTLIATLYETPSCSDGKQNQGEEGIDCGGSCSRVCDASAMPPTVSFVRDVKGLNGRTDVVAYVENPNGFAAAKGVKYTIELFSEDRVLLATREGTLELPPAAGVAVYVPNVYSGTRVVAQAFLEIDDASLLWYRYDDTRPVLRVSDETTSGTEAAPRISARLTNPTVETLNNLVVIATVFDAEGNAIAATQTVVASVPPQGSATALFTFAAPFPSTPSRIDVQPRIPLP